MNTKVTKKIKSNARTNKRVAQRSETLIAQRPALPPYSKRENSLINKLKELRKERSKISWSIRRIKASLVKIKTKSQF